MFSLFLRASSALVLSVAFFHAGFFQAAFAADESKSTGAVIFSTSGAESVERCWKSYSPTVFEWTCAAEHLPASAQAFALSIWVLDSPKALLVLDTGATASVGVAAATAISQKFAGKPFFILNTQPKAEHVLGNVGFKELWAKNLPAGQTFESRLAAGQQTAKLMAQRCPDCIKLLAERMGAQAIAGTQPVIPAFALTAKRGNLGVLGIGFKPWLYELESNLDSEQTLIVRNKDMGIEWVANLVQPQVVPDLHEGNVVERIDFLGKLHTRLHDGDKLLGSFGQIEPIWVRRNLRYFADLQLDVLTKSSQGTSEVEIINQSTGDLKSAQPQLDAKSLEVHQLNVQRVYRQVEKMAF
ncbi:MAG: hypothetical protein QE278_14245 [Limnobacter sp.]|nr:hypothetical protein [Limnobacter sp.]